MVVFSSLKKKVNANKQKTTSTQLTLSLACVNYLQQTSLLQQLSTWMEISGSRVPQIKPASPNPESFPCLWLSSFRRTGRECKGWDRADDVSLWPEGRGLGWVGSASCQEGKWGTARASTAQSGKHRWAANQEVTHWLPGEGQSQAPQGGPQMDF